jgi:hypothetical protein
MGGPIASRREYMRAIVSKGRFGRNRIHNEAGAGGGGGLGRGASFASGQLLAAALLGVAGGGHSNRLR